MSLCHRDKLSVVISDRRYFMRHNQMGLGVDGRLDIIAHKACPFFHGQPWNGHPDRSRISAIGRIFQLPCDA